MSGGAAPTVKVYYLLGTARSGSTLLASLLGGQPGFFAVGELRLMWRDLDTRRCGCGARLRSCPVWSRVFREIAVEDPDFDGAEFHRLQRERARARNLPRALLGSRSNGPRDPYADRLATVYRAIARATGCQVIVDSSKQAIEPALLSRDPSVEMFPVHLVRDPRAVAYSGRRRALRKSIRPRSPLRRALGYLFVNATAESVARLVPSRRHLFVRYEDLVEDPPGTIAGLVAAAGVDGGGADGLSGHMVGGNRLRFDGSTPEVRPAEQTWRRELGSGPIRIVTTLTYPLLRRYGYR